jgi:hypothetical protein
MDEDYDRALNSHKAWVTPEELAGLQLGREVVEDMSPVDQARRIMLENAPMAAMSLVRLAQFGETENVRLRASIEILNRADQAGTVNGKEPWADLYDTTSVEKHANTTK